MKEKLKNVDEFVWLLLLIPLLLKFGLPSAADLTTSLVDFAGRLSF